MCDVLAVALQSTAYVQSVIYDAIIGAKLRKIVLTKLNERVRWSTRGRLVRNPDNDALTPNRAHRVRLLTREMGCVRF